MELYKISGYCSNDNTTHVFAHEPENFQGVVMAQKFNWQNPIGYSSTASLETIKALLEDRTWIVNLFDTYGLQTDITLTISKLNSTATAYVDNAITFKIDFESYSKNSTDAEFPLKAVSCIDEYDKLKNTARNFTGVSMLSLPTTQKYINYLSLKKDEGIVSGDPETLGDFPVQINQGFLTMSQNGTSKVYNDDTALFNDPKNVYEFNRVDGTVDIVLKGSGSLLIGFNWSGSSMDIAVKLYRTTYDNPIFTLATKTVNIGAFTTIEIDAEKTKLTGVSYEDGDFLFVGIESTASNCTFTSITGGFSLDMWVSTEKTANEFSKKVPYLTAEAILNVIFNNQITIENGLKGLGVTSSLSIANKLDYISLIPKDFITDFCLATGSMINFKPDGTVELSKIGTFFPALLQKANAISIDNFKNLKITYDTSLNFASVSVGMEKKDNEVFTYFDDWNKPLTFNQSGRVASENLNLILTKYRVDYSGILNCVSKTGQDSANDIYIFDPTFTSRTASAGTIYDYCTPRDILENWRKFLEICFYNYNLDTLELSANGGDDYNLQIAGVNQFDDFVFSGTNPRITPIKAELTGILNAQDYSEKLITINDGTTDLYIFVTEVKTGDNLSEQKITGNLIYFAS